MNNTGNAAVVEGPAATNPENPLRGGPKWSSTNLGNGEAETKVLEKKSRKLEEKQHL